MKDQAIEEIRQRRRDLCKQKYGAPLSRWLPPQCRSIVATLPRWSVLMTDKAGIVFPRRARPVNLACT